MMIIFEEGVSVEYHTTPPIVNVPWWFEIACRNRRRRT